MTEIMRAKQAKVAAVVTQFKVVLNVGAVDGIEVDQDFVLYRQSEEIRDPDTDEVLGVFEEVIGRGVVTHVQEKISTLESSDVSVGGQKVVRKAGRGSISYLSSLFVPDTEEVLNLPDQPRPFSGAQIGDFAKRL